MKPIFLHKVTEPTLVFLSSSIEKHPALIQDIIQVSSWLQEGYNNSEVFMEEPGDAWCNERCAGLIFHTIDKTLRVAWRGPRAYCFMHGPILVAEILFPT